MRLEEVKARVGPFSTAHYRRTFSDLPPFDPPGGDSDAQFEWIRNRARSLMNGPTGSRKSRIPAGYTYFGQLLVHDLVHTHSVPGVLSNQAVNLHQPVLDLQCIYGAGPDRSPELYHRDRSRFLIGGNADPARVELHRSRPRPLRTALADLDLDVPRSSQGLALIADWRDDSTVMLSQLHLCLLLAHNRLVEAGVGQGKSGQPLEKAGCGFADARRTLRRHYQWIVVHEYLKLILEEKVYRRFLKDLQEIAELPMCRRLDHALGPRTLPIEFVAAAMRFGHSMPRSEYRLNDRTREPIPLAPADRNTPEFRCLTGFKSLPLDWTIDWRYFLGADDTRLQTANPIDPCVTPHFQRLPAEPVPGPLAEFSVLERTLLRDWAWGIPGGRAVAQALGLAPLAGADEPLWLYLLREARQESKDGLGPVGSRLVADALFDVLTHDPESLWVAEPEWLPEIHDRGRRFRLLDLLDFAQGRSARPSRARG